MDLRDLLAAGVVGLGDDVRLAARRGARLGALGQRRQPLARELERLAHAGQPRGDRADERSGLHRPRERAEPAEVDVDLL